MLHFPPPLAPDSFLAEFWQKKALVLSGALPDSLPFIGANELAWLATQEDVEARLVFTDSQDGASRYRVQQGPFSERRLARLPAENWTLLIHDVDKHLPEFRRYFDVVPFIPDWRIDDLMISVAAPGGSVGPHRDNYDVFLCQSSGVRDWRLAWPEDAVPRRRASALALLEPFAPRQALAAGPSDVLYLPPGVPHWGIGRDLCISCSIGMRAPTRQELCDALSTPAPSVPNADDAFYADPDLESGEASPGLISPRALQRALQLVQPCQPDRPVAMQRLARAFGSVVTRPKSWLEPEPPDEGLAARVAGDPAAHGELRVHGMARLAWCRLTETVALVFANGQPYAASTGQLEVFRELCSARLLRPDRIAAALRDAGDAEWLQRLVANGTFDLTENA